jgi:hypothetical protein
MSAHITADTQPPERARDSASSAVLLDALLDAQLILFGRFERDGQVFPYQLRLDMLASYPHVLALAGARAAAHIERSAHPPGAKLRLLAEHAAVPFATAAALTLSTPLVTAEKSNDGYRWAGAYDIGHPTWLLVLTDDDVPQTGHMAGLAARVGLNIVGRIALVGGGAADAQRADTALCTVDALAAAAHARGLISAAFLRAAFMQNVVMRNASRRNAAGQGG